MAKHDKTPSLLFPAKGPPRMRLSLTRGEVERLHEEIGDLNVSVVGPKLMELYKNLDAILAVEWDERKFMQQQRGGARL